jgi:glucokinase
VRNRLLAIDVGGSRVKWAAVEDGEVGELHHEPTRRPLAALVGQITEVHAATAADAWGICVPGLLDSKRGFVRLAANLGLHDVDFLATIRAAGLPPPAAFLNDVEAAALGEAAGGTLALLQVGTGLAGRFVTGGRVLVGSNGLAGEVGHLRFRSDGLPCACGLKGCVEAYAGWGGIRRRLSERGLAISEPESLLEQATSDPWAAATLAEAFEALAYAAAAVIVVCDPGELRLGGGLVHAWGERIDAFVRDVIAESVLPDLARATRVTRSTLGDRASLLGIARAARPA